MQAFLCICPILLQQGITYSYFSDISVQFKNLALLPLVTVTVTVTVTISPRSDLYLHTHVLEDQPDASSWPVQTKTKAGENTAKTRRVLACKINTDLVNVHNSSNLRLINFFCNFFSRGYFPVENSICRRVCSLGQLGPRAEVI